MLTKFAIYALVDGEVFLTLPGPPDNDDFLTTGEVIYAGRPRASGIKWSAVGIWQNNAGVALDETHRWRYDTATSEFVDLGPMEEPQ